MIRKLEAKDYSNLQKIFSELYQIHYKNRPDVFTPNHPITQEYFNEILTSNCKHCYVYEEKGNLLGAILFKEIHSENYASLNKRTYFAIYDIAVISTHRRQGIGTKLYNFVLELAKQNNVNAVQVDVWAFNIDAIKFYEKLNMKIKKYTYETILKK